MTDGRRLAGKVAIVTGAILFGLGPSLLVAPFTFAVLVVIVSDLAARVRAQYPRGVGTARPPLISAR